MLETVKMPSMELRFLHTPESTGGSLTMFEMHLFPGGRMPVPHHHRDWEETVYGLMGTTTWIVDGRNVEVGPGESLFIERGIVHGFTNNTPETAVCLSILTPGVLSPAYLREMATLVEGGRPDPARMKETMLRHGLVPKEGVMHAPDWLRSACRGRQPWAEARTSCFRLRAPLYPISRNSLDGRTEMRSFLTARAVGIVAAVCASSAAGQSPPPVPLAFSGEIQFNKALQKETFNDVSTIDVTIPPGNGSTLVITYSVPVQGNVTDACQILSQTLLDDHPTSIQQIDQLGHSGTITVRTTQVVPLVSPGVHHVSFQVYPVCDGLMAAHTVWDHGVWGGFYNYVIIER